MFFLYLTTSLLRAYFERETDGCCHWIFYCLNHRGYREVGRSGAAPFVFKGAGLEQTSRNTNPSHRSITLGTRKYGGSGSGACFKSSTAACTGTSTSSRKVASAV